MTSTLLSSGLPRLEPPTAQPPQISQPHHQRCKVYNSNANDVTTAMNSCRLDVHEPSLFSHLISEPKRNLAPSWQPTRLSFLNSSYT